MKKALIILTWFLYFSGAEKTDKWVELLNDNGTITKVKRWEYLEYKELLSEEWISSEFQKPYIRIKHHEIINEK